jgi:hypothetical protein
MLAIVSNNSTATASVLNGFATSWSNTNPNSGAIGRWVAFGNGPMQGGGHAPLGNFAFNNSDPAATIITLGGIVIGGTVATNQQTGPGTLLITGADTSPGTFPFVVKNSAGTNLLYVNNSGDVSIPNDLTVTAAISSTTGGVTAGTVLNTGTYTVSTLPTESTHKGCRAFVTDATSPTFMGTLTGGGAVVCPVFCNGAAWLPA